MLEIRLAGPEDAPTLLHFIRALAAYERMPDAVEVDEPTLRQQLSAADPPFACLLAEDAGSALGFALFFRTYSTWRGKPGIWLEDLFVLPEARRRGIGRALLMRLAQLAHERGYARFEWSVLDWNQPAIDFYRRLGAEVLDQWRICRISDAALVELARS
jgi:GNAT superfamily N-acetyltransferase